MSLNIDLKQETGRNHIVLPRLEANFLLQSVEVEAIEALLHKQPERVGLLVTAALLPSNKSIHSIAV